MKPIHPEFQEAMIEVSCVIGLNLMVECGSCKAETASEPIWSVTDRERCPCQQNPD